MVTSFAEQVLQWNLPAVALFALCNEKCVCPAYQPNQHLSITLRRGKNPRLVG